MEKLDRKFIDAVRENNIPFLSKHLSSWKEIADKEYNFDEICSEITSREVLELVYPHIITLCDYASVYILECLDHGQDSKRERLRMVSYIARHPDSLLDQECSDTDHILQKYAERGLFPEIIIIAKAIHKTYL